MKEIRVRYAPSPTGYLHIGNARTAIFNYLFARHVGGKFIIRVENTDVARNIEGGEKSQLDNLKWLNVEWDESIDIGGEYGPYDQLSRVELGLYTPFVNKLLDEKKAYKCFCTSEELDAEAEKQKAAGEIPKYSGKCGCLSDEEVAQKEAKGEEYSVRFRVPTDIDIKWDDVVKGNILFNSQDVSGDFNIVKRDGIPTYNFAVVVDDHLMKISHVLRGEDHISNTPKQIMLYDALEVEAPQFGHMALIVNETGKKLSKRDGGIIQFIEQYKDLGYIPEALFNFITLLGWSPQGEEEIFNRDEFIKIFDETRLSKSSATFDVNKLTWINNNYMKALEEEKYIELTYPFLKEKYNVKLDDRTKKILMLYKNQISYGKEIEEVASLFFEQFDVSSEALEFLGTIESESLATLISILKSKLEDESFELTQDNFKALMKEIQTTTGLKGKNLYMPTRIYTTGLMHGPELLDTLSLLGSEKILENITSVENKKEN